MTTPLSCDDVEVGDELPARNFPIRRADLVRYAGASGDFNPIHWNQAFARSVGLPDVIAHGMFTMAQAGRMLTDWVGDPGAVEEYSARFVRPVVVPDGLGNADGTRLTVAAVVKEKLPDRRVRVELQVTCGAERVLSAARAVIRLA